MWRCTGLWISSWLFEVASLCLDFAAISQNQMLVAVRLFGTRTLKDLEVK